LLPFCPFYCAFHTCPRREEQNHVAVISLGLYIKSAPSTTSRPVVSVSNGLLLKLRMLESVCKTSHVSPERSQLMSLAVRLSEHGVTQQHQRRVNKQGLLKHKISSSIFGPIDQSINEKLSDCKESGVHQKLRRWSPRRRSMDNHHRAVQCRVAVQTKGLHDRPRLNKVSMGRKEGEMGDKGDSYTLAAPRLEGCLSAMDVLIKEVKDETWPARFPLTCGSLGYTAISEVESPSTLEGPFKVSSNDRLRAE